MHRAGWHSLGRHRHASGGTGDVLFAGHAASRTDVRGHRCGRASRWRGTAPLASHTTALPGTTHMVLAVAGSLVGAVSFSGPLIAFAKLQGWMDKRWIFPAQRFANLALLALAVILGTGRCARWSRHRVGVLRIGTDVRIDHDAAHRWRRHAGGDFVVQRADRPGGGVRGFRAGQRGHDHRRHGGRSRRHLGPRR